MSSVKPMYGFFNHRYLSHNIIVSWQLNSPPRNEIQVTPDQLGRECVMVMVLSSNRKYRHMVDTRKSSAPDRRSVNSCASTTDARVKLKRLRRRTHACRQTLLYLLPPFRSSKSLIINDYKLALNIFRWIIVQRIAPPAYINTHA